MLRRRVLAVPAVTTVTAVTAFVAACSSTDASDDAPTEGGWTYTDSVCATVTLDAAPTRIAGYTDTVGSLWNYGVKPVALFGWSSLEDDTQFDGKDTTDVTQVGAAYGEIDLEALAAVTPDVILVPVYPADRGDVPTDASLRYGFNDEAQEDFTTAPERLQTAAAAGLSTYVIAGFEGEGIYTVRPQDEPATAFSPPSG